jgi:hypothetical protein
MSRAIAKGERSLRYDGQLDRRWQTPLVPTSPCAILTTGAIREAPIVRNGDIVVGRVMSASLTFDHRIVSGVPAGLFLETLGALLEGGSGEVGVGTSLRVDKWRSRTLPRQSLSDACCFKAAPRLGISLN